MLHPVGPLPAGVYWRRRLLVVLLLLALLGGGGWLVFLLLTDRGAEGSSEGAAAGSTSRAPGRPPALERVVPSLAGVLTPSVPPTVTPEGTPEAAPATDAAAAGPTPGGRCGDEMLTLAVRAPATVAVGGKPTFELVVTNASAVPCVRALDKELQELVLLDPAGARLWGSNDCFPEASDDTRTLQPGEAVAFPVLWGGLTSEPTCTAERVPPPAGTYVVRGRLDTKVSTDAPLTLE